LLAEQVPRLHDHAWGAANVVDRIREIASRLSEEVSIDPARCALPPRTDRAGERVQHAEVRVLPFQRRQLGSVRNFVFAATAVDEPDRNGQFAAGCIFGHAFEGRDADPSGDENRGSGFVQHKSPIGPKMATSSPGRNAAKARLYQELERRTAYSRCGRVGLSQATSGARQHPPRSSTAGNVNCVARNLKDVGFSSSTA